ncbi:uncharacterized protein [Solanum lycopersicum]|uniref:uncharacterized protein n=1 Tax=Solanum lycopersicum TaxID=4081 RepID=UPI00374905EA
MSINAPKLRSFVFRGAIQLIHLENVPVLSNVLYAPRELVLEDEDDFVNFFRLFLLSSASAGIFLRSIMDQLKLYQQGFHQFLTECILSDGDYFESVPQEVVDEILASFLDITFNHLRTVKLYDIPLEEVEMQLIKVLLEKSPALAKMVIKPRQMETNKSLNVLAEITKFQRASSKAEVVYLFDYYRYHNSS